MDNGQRSKPLNKLEGGEASKARLYAECNSAFLLFEQVMHALLVVAVEVAGEGGFVGY